MLNLFISSQISPVQSILLQSFFQNPNPERKDLRRLTSSIFTPSFAAEKDNSIMVKNFCFTNFKESNECLV
jgi:hypothetical protein